ncbi:hypothetical protein MPSEU_000949900 [Mayamaea pseudoterrestris]|nr:hypothetical protein MPSEU_000949900 [Mayamaea pseudoterrestris]
MSLAQRNATQIINNFENSKNQCLGKRDKSSAGRIDPRAVDICSVINSFAEFYTTSSCAGRCYLYQGQGIKATDDFKRYRVSHEKIDDAKQYFNLTNLKDDAAHVDDLSANSLKASGQTSPHEQNTAAASEDAIIWLRYEAFILHVACRNLSAAGALMAAARPYFKNVGLTTWKDGKYLVLILGDEALEMPVTTLDGRSLVDTFSCEWLAKLVNERHERNWRKIEGFVDLARNMVLDDDDSILYELDNEMIMLQQQSTEEGIVAPRSFDVIGDIAVINALDVDDELERQRIGEQIMRKNKAIKLVVARDSTLQNVQRAPGCDGMTVVAGMSRSPMITTHSEYGIKCVVDLEHTFFTPRMASERLRLCQQVSRGENVLVLFCGVGLEAFHIVARTEANSVLAIDVNSTAMTCAHRGKRMLERNKSVKVPNAAARLQLMEGDVLEVLPTLERGFYDRVLVPRPKEGSKDGDLGDGKSGLPYLLALLPVLKAQADIHWFDFVADHEYPSCGRSCSIIAEACQANGFNSQVLHVSKLQSVAMRQLRVCIDIRLTRIVL